MLSAWITFKIFYSDITGISLFWSSLQILHFRIPEIVNVLFLACDASEKISSYFSIFQIHYN